MQASTQKPVREVMKTLTKAMNDHDPDVAEMAAKDLANHIKNGSVDLKAPENKDLAQLIVQDYLKQVGSLNFVVHSAAIRCLAEIVPFLTKQELIYIFKSTISSITDPKTESKRMQVFSSSANTMINLAPADIGIDLAQLFVECVNEFLKLSSKKNSKQEEDVLIHLLHLIIDFSQKWPDVAGSREVKYDRHSLIQILMKNVQESTKLDIARKSDVALQKLAAIFDKNNFQFLLNHKNYGLLKFILNHEKASDEDNLKKLRNGISCLNHIVHTHNRELKPWAKEITKICIELVNHYKENNQNIVLASEIIQSSIDCLTSLIKAYSSQLSEWVGNGKYHLLSSFLQQTLNYDPEGMMQYLNTESEMQDQEMQEQYYNENSVCWKVREISLNYTTVLMRKDPSFKGQQGKSVQFLHLLSTKLIEENENVNKKAFECFNFIIQSISTVKKDDQEEQQGVPLRRVKSNEGDFALQLVDKISNKIQILFNHRKTKQQTKTEAAKTLLNLIQLLHELIKDNQTACYKILTLIQNLLPKVKADSSIFLIKSSKSLLNGSLPYEKAQNTIDVYIKMCKSNNFKVVAASFDGIRNSIKHYHNQILKSGKINQILMILIPKLKEHDADKLIKIQAIRCLGPIFIYLFNNLPENTQNELLAASEVKLKVEIDKTAILSQIPRIPEDYVVKKSQENTFKNILDLCSESIGIVNYEISNLSVQSCNRIIRLKGLTVNQKTAEAILNKIRPMLIEQKIPKFLDHLIDKFPNTLKPYGESIIKAGDSYYIRRLIDQKIVSSERSIEILKSVVTVENYKKLSVIISQIQPSKQKLLSQLNATNWGLACMGALGYVGDLSTIDQIQKFFINNQNHDLKFEGARSIGNIASRYPDYATKLIDLSRKSSEGYLYLHALKEMLTFSEKQFPNIQNIIHFVFAKCQESDRQTNKHLLAQCIGNISRISHTELKSILKSVNEMNPARKFIVASSLRYAFENIGKDSILDEVTEDYIKKIIQLTRDYDVNVKQGALKSLNSIAETHLDQIRHFFDEKFMDTLFDSLTIKPELIKIIDYGVSKEKKDLGKGLRIQAFNFLKSIILTRQVEKYYEKIVGKCLQKINEQTSNDIILKRVLIIRLACQKDFTSFVPHQNEFSVRLGIDGVLKSYLTSNTTEDERSQGYLKGLFKQILTIMKLSTEGTESIKATINKIKTNEKLRNIIEQVENTQ